MLGYFDTPTPKPTVEGMRADFARLHVALTAQRRRADNVDSWLKPEAHGFDVPRRAKAEHRALADLSRTPWLRLVVDNVAQAMYVDQIVGTGGTKPDLWALWAVNGCPKTQISNHRSVAAYGDSYSVVTPAQRGGEDSARIRFLSPRRVTVEFDDPGASLYPSVALEAHSPRDTGRRFTLYYPGYSVEAERHDTGVSFAEPVSTGVDVVQVVQFANQADLDGNVTGEVEPFIPTAQRINKTTYDRLLAQHFSSWKVKTATGLGLPSRVDEDGLPTDEVDPVAAEELRQKLAQDDILIGEDPETKFGTLDATALDPFVAAWQSDVEALAAVAQTPAHALTGKLVNLNAEALAAARAPLTQKITERQVNLGMSYSLTLRLAASFAGLGEVAADDLVRVTWQDMEIRSMSQAVDALGKAATLLDIPKRGLWARIPGVESSDVEEWERLADDENERDPLNRVFGKGAEPTGVPPVGDPTDGYSSAGDNG